MEPSEKQQEIYPTRTAATPEFLDMVWRRKWLILGSAILSLAVAGAYCIVAPKQYRSETLILVEDQKIPELYVRGVAEGNLEQRIFLIQKQLTSRAILGDIVKEFNLYPEAVEIYGLDGGTSMLAQDLLVEMVGKGQRGNFVTRTGIDAFTVSFAHEDPSVAMKVTGKLAMKFIEENLKAREQTAEGTTEFFESEVRRAKVELEKKEDQISQFKSAHIGELPQQVETNLRALDRMQSDLNVTNENVQRQTDRLEMMDKAIQEYERFGTKNPVLAVGPTAIDPLFPRLKELQEKLVKLQAEFWEGYPEVVLTKEEIRQVERKLVELYGPDVFKPGERLVDPYLRDLRRQREEVKSEIALSSQRLVLLHAEKKNYEKRIDRAPEVEQELLILERYYNNIKYNYRALLDKRLNAMVSQNLEKRQQGAQFRILDTANFPTSPEKPNRPRILIFGVLFGCALGLGIAVIREQFHPQFRRPEEVEQLLGPQLLAVIPDFSFEYDRVRWYNRIGWNRSLPVNEKAEASGEGIDGGAARTIVSKGLLGQRRDAQSFKDSFIVNWLPNSNVAEQYRVAATRLLLARTKGQSTVVAVTSAIKGEGKTTTVINLGYTMARDLGKRTLILDCDFKCPMLHHYAETVPKWGLADCLIGDIPLDDCLFGFEDEPCWIMPVGSSDVHPTELLKSERLAGILAQVRARFDYIFINTPPIFPLAAMNILARHADILLLVVRADSTPKQIVQRALSSLPSSVPAHVILNGVRHQALPSYMGTYEYLAKQS
jgi:polysaccharide chain length determinant protein (PEP-CTERM system associated)